LPKDAAFCIFDVPNAIETQTRAQEGIGELSGSGRQRSEVLAACRGRRQAIRDCPVKDHHGRYRKSATETMMPAKGVELERVAFNRFCIRLH